MNMRVIQFQKGVRITIHLLGDLNLKNDPFEAAF